MILLDENKKFRDFTGVTKFHDAGYFGSRVVVATGESQYAGKAEAHGYRWVHGLPGYSTGDDWHGTQTAFIFWQVAPEATLITIPDAVCKINGVSYDFNVDGLALVEQYGVTLMYLSMLRIVLDGRDEALAEHPNFFYATSDGNFSSDSYNQLTECENIYGVGSYYLSDNGTVTIPSYTSETKHSDFAAPAKVYYNVFGTSYPFDGTSCAAPYLIGMCALVQDFFIDKTGKPLTRDAMYRFLKDHTVDIGDAGKDTKSGWGAVILPDPSEIDIAKYAGGNMIIEKTYEWAYPLTERFMTDCIVLHHAAVSVATPDQIHAAHLANGWSGIAYHYYVRKDGTIYRGRPESTVGAHTHDENYHTIGVCFEGNFMDETMNETQLEAGKWLIADIKTRYPDVDVKAHRDFNATGCPGDNFPFDEITGGIELRYNTIDEIPDWGKPTIQKLIDKGALKGTGEGFDISADMLRMFVINDRMGLYN